MKILIIGISFSILSYVFRKRFNVYIGFLPIFILMAFQDGLQTDIINYEQGFYNIQNFGHLGRDFNIAGFHNEIGWETLTRIFSPFNFRVFLFFIVFVQYLIICKFIKKYVDKEYQYLGGIIFYLTYNMMLMQMTALRQGLATELALLAFMFVDDKKFKLALLTTVAMPLIHTSSIILIPFIVGLYVIKCTNLLTREQRYNEFVLPTIVTVIYILLFIFKGVFMQQLTAIASSISILNYGHYLNELDYIEISELYVLYNGIIIFFVSWYMQQASQTLRFFSILTIIGCFGEMLVFGLGSLPRIFMYFQIINIIIIPNVVTQIHKRFGWCIAILLILLCIGYGYKSIEPLMSNDRYKNFHFIFE